MNLTCYFVTACIIIVLSVVATVLVSKSVKLKSNRVVTPFNTVFAGLFLATLCMMIPVYYSRYAEAELWGNSIRAFLLAVQGTIQVFTIDADSSLINEIPNSGIGNVYSLVLSVLYMIAPVLTFGFVFSFFKNVSAYAQFFFQKRKDLYVFSELNEKSLALATDIKKHDPKVSLIFNDVFEKNDEESYEIIGRAKELGAICFKKDILAVKYSQHSKQKKLCLFVIGEDEAENIGQALKLIGMYGKVQNSRLYVFSTTADSELLLAHNKGMPMKVRRINRVRSLVNRSLYENGKMLFDNAITMENGEKKIHAVIIGLGRHGTEMLKALTWFCQMDGYHLEIDAYDSDPHAEERFSALCPELVSEKYNGVSVPGETEYTIHIHSGVDVGTVTFAESIGSMKDVTYSFVALGTDEENVKVAVNMRMLYERAGIKPKIQAVIYNPDEKTALEGITNYCGQSYDIECIGDLRTMYSEAVIINSELERAAFEIHKGYCNGDTEKEQEFWRYEYNYRSSMSSAIHKKVRKELKIDGADKSEEEWTKEEREKIEKLEHRRWNAYMRSEGYIYSGSPDRASRNDLAKMHHNLVVFSSLSDEDKRKDGRVGSR